MKKGKQAALSILGLGFAALAAGGSHMASFVVHGKRQTLEEALAWQSTHYDISWYKSLQREDYTVESYDGYELHAQLCRAAEPSGRYVILTHGYTDNRIGNLKYMKLYLDRGYNCVNYDLRGHGQNEPAICTYSIREGKDLYEMIRDTRARYPDMTFLGLHGESLGAASTVSALGYQVWAKADGLPVPYVDFAVADCGFADIENVLRGAFGKMVKAGGEALAAPAVALASAACRVRYGYSFGQMKPILHLADNKVPVLFIHGEKDTFIPPSNSERMAAANPAYTECRLIPEAGHAQSVLKQPELYRQYLYGFLDRIEKQENGENR